MKKTLSCALVGVTAFSCLAMGLAAPAKAVAYDGAQPLAGMEESASAALTSGFTNYSAEPEVSTSYPSPLTTLRADPYLYKDKDTGKYYFTGSYPTYDRIELTSADTVSGISDAVPKIVWTMPRQDWFDPNDQFPAFLWAPEIHKIKDQWVIYFTLSDVGKWDIRSCALICKGDDPMTDEWVWAGYMKPVAEDDFSFRAWGFSLDMTAFENNGRWYVVWAQKNLSDNISSLYLAELDADHPTKLLSKPVLLTQPEYAWELVREKVNEGPAVLKHAGKIFVSFSAAATGYEYCMGLLEIDSSADLLVKSNWKKYSEPVFQTDESRNIYGPGHNSFVEGDNGEPLCILHFRNYKDIVGDSLLDYNRHAHVMKITFDKAGFPQFNIDEKDLFNTPFQNHGR